MPIDRTKLIFEINEAFKNVELDSGIGLSEANAIDDYSDEHFREKCRQNDEKHNWNSISSAALNKYNCSLSYFDARGMTFHLPAFLIADIKGEYRFEMAFILTNLSNYNRSRFTLLTEKQRAAVKLFLEYMLENPEYKFEKPDIKLAIENYWSK